MCIGIRINVNVPALAISLILVLVGISSSVLDAAEIEFSPATFGASAEEFNREFDVSDFEFTEELVIRCGAEIRNNGRVRSLLCEAEPKRGRTIRRALRRIENIFRNFTIEPAIVDGKATQVWYNFSFIASPGSNALQIVDNHLHSKETLGLNYSAPQRYDYPKLTGCASMPEEGMHVEAMVNLEGKISDVKVLGGMQGFGSCKMALSNSFRNSKFIPALADGEPKNALFVEFFTWEK